MAKKPNALTRDQLAQELFREVGLSRSEANDLVNQLFDHITDALIGEHSVKLPDFGTFISKRRGRRIGRNPKTGEEVPIEPHIAVSFRPSRKLKAKVDESLKQHQGIPKT